MLLLALWPDVSIAQDDPLYADLTPIEQAQVRQILDAFSLERELEPDTKRFGQALVTRARPFYPSRTWPDLSWLNNFHTMTDRDLIMDEVLWQVGDPYDVELVWETVRNLERFTSLTVIAAVPIRNSENPGVVDVLIVTRDILSIRATGDIRLPDFRLDLLSFRFGETNLGGLHKELLINHILEPDTLELGLAYVDSRLHGSRLTLLEDFRVVWNHELNTFEGSVNQFELSYPLYSLASEWGFVLRESHDIRTERVFESRRLQTYDDPETSVIEAAPISYEQQEVAALAALLIGWRYGTTRHELEVGWGISDREYSPTESDFALVEPSVRAAFERDVLQRSELRSFLHLGYSVYVPVYERVRNYQHMYFSEELRVGPELGFVLELAPGVFGSDNGHLRGRADVSSRMLLGDWVLELGVGTAGRFEIGRSDLIDLELSAALRVATPVFGPFRLHLGGETTLQFRRETEQLLALSAVDGLRGFSDEFLGNRRMLSHLELRTTEILALLGFRFGLVVFTDAAVNTDISTPGERRFLGSVGFGIRAVPFQTRGALLRLDYAVPYSGGDVLPGAISLGVEQVF